MPRLEVNGRPRPGMIGQLDARSSGHQKYPVPVRRNPDSKKKLPLEPFSAWKFIGRLAQLR